MKGKVDITEHLLVPKCVKMAEQEKKELFKKYNISFQELPFIQKNDASIRHLKTKPGDVIRIIRKSPTAGETVFYRGVIDD